MIEFQNMIYEGTNDEFNVSSVQHKMEKSEQLSGQNFSLIKHMTPISERKLQIS
jgi:hypothetical protein